MNREMLGSITNWEPGSDTEWAYDMAMQFLAVAVGDTPPGVRLDVAWLDHDFGPYPSLVVEWPDFGDEPREFIRRADHALWELNQAVDWDRIRPSSFAGTNEEALDAHADGLDEN